MYIYINHRGDFLRVGLLGLLQLADGGGDQRQEYFGVLMGRRVA